MVSSAAKRVATLAKPKAANRPVWPQKLWREEVAFITKEPSHLKKSLKRACVVQTVAIRGSAEFGFRWRPFIAFFELALLV
jgi:hypothetical protein